MQPAPVNTSSASLAMDVQGVDALKRTARQAPQEGLKQAAQQFEALFLQMMLKSMREATPGEHMLGGSAEKFYTGMLDQQLGQSLSGRGLGLAEAMQRQLMRHLAPDEATPADATAATPLAFTPGLTQPAWSRPALRSTPTEPAGAAVPSGNPAAALNPQERLTAAATWSRSALAPAHVERFMSQHLPAAQRASEVSGVPAQLILAQAALESGWGRREPRGEGGEPSFNLFGIKADKSWKGPSVEVLTTEFIQGENRSVRARFRAYSSYAESFADHARFLSSNPRYAPVLQAPDAHRAAENLQRAGYATDPHYATKLQRLMQQIS
jgi:peptidoglycan hydrolase FlgJ